MTKLIKKNFQTENQTEPLKLVIRPNQKKLNRWFWFLDRTEKNRTEEKLDRMALFVRFRKKYFLTTCHLFLTKKLGALKKALLFSKQSKFRLCTLSTKM